MNTFLYTEFIGWHCLGAESLLIKSVKAFMARMPWLYGMSFKKIQTSKKLEHEKLQLSTAHKTGDNQSYFYPLSSGISSCVRTDDTLMCLYYQCNITIIMGYIWKHDPIRSRQGYEPGTFRSMTSLVQDWFQSCLFNFLEG